MKIAKKLNRAVLKIFFGSRPFVKVLNEYFKLLSRGKKGKTILNYEGFETNITEYFDSIGFKAVVLHELKPKHMESMRMWLFENLPRCSKNHASRHINHCIGAFEYAKKLGYIKDNPISGIQTEQDELSEPVSCSIGEIQKFLNSGYLNYTWQLVVDLFLFQCFTGISHMDLWLFQLEEETVKNKEGNWIKIKLVTSGEGRGKNGKPYSAYLNKHAEAIYKKYKGKFPKISYSTYYTTLKKICFDLNITKDLSTHNGRKTYASLRLNQGISLEALEQEMGNTIKTLKKHYLPTSRVRVKRESVKLMDEPFLQA